MKNRTFIVISLLVLLASLAGNPQTVSSATPEPQALVYVYLESPGDVERFAATQLPVFSWLEQGVLTGADQLGQETLEQAGLRFTVLDLELASGTYYLAESLPVQAKVDFSLYAQVLLQIDHTVVLRMDPTQAEGLALAGAQLSRITLTPKPLPSTQAVESSISDTVTPDPVVQGMIDLITQDQAYTYLRQLAGELPVWVDGGWYTITTRRTYSGTPIMKAISYVGQHMEDLGLEVEYHQWGGSTYPNVIGEIRGLYNPEDIFIIGGHLDDVSGTPGADDNASGSVATLLAADILSEYQWNCTLRFAFWTGEEQGLYGSGAYALRSYQLGEDIGGYLNLDMIAYNTPQSSPGIDLMHKVSLPSTLVLAQLFANVITSYELNLLPGLVTGLRGGSDHSSFWDYGYTSILAIEDQGDFNPYYHGPSDTPANTDPAYFTSFVKAALATYVHMSGCLIRGNGNLDGHISDASNGVPLAGVTVSTLPGDFHTTTDETGYYTLTLPSIAQAYSVMAVLDDYFPQTHSASILPGQSTTLDFALQRYSWEYFFPLVWDD